MQSLIQVVCAKGPSLRDAIGDDAKRLDEFGLFVVEQRRVGRRRGWSKLHSGREGAYGAINVQWDKAASVLVCRVVTRGAKPSKIVGDFVGYLFSRYKSRIQAINVFP
jgi:hypothetical protein